jgi:hypothetical protein
MYFMWSDTAVKALRYCKFIQGYQLDVHFCQVDR